MSDDIQAISANVRYGVRTLWWRAVVAPSSYGEFTGHAVYSRWQVGVLCLVLYHVYCTRQQPRRDGVSLLVSRPEAPLCHGECQA